MFHGVINVHLVVVAPVETNILLLVFGVTFIVFYMHIVSSSSDAHQT